MILSPFEDEQKRTRYYVVGSESWEQFEQLVKFVRRSVSGIIIERIDGPDARIWKLSVANQLVTFTHNDMLGNCFFSEDANAAGVLQDVIGVVEKAEL